MLYCLLFKLVSSNENKTFYSWNFCRVQSKGKKNSQNCHLVLLRGAFVKIFLKALHSFITVCKVKLLKHLAPFFFGVRLCWNPISKYNHCWLSHASVLHSAVQYTPKHQPLSVEISLLVLNCKTLPDSRIPDLARYWKHTAPLLAWDCLWSSKRSLFLLGIGTGGLSRACTAETKTDCWFNRGHLWQYVTQPCKQKHGKSDIMDTYQS